MITLYHCDGARSFRPLWMLEEMGLPYELKMLPFPPRVFAKEYLAINPLGTIPFMVDGETKMTESSGICHYLGTRYGPTPLVVGVDEPAYGAFLNWMYFSDATLTFPQTLVLRYSQLEPEERRNPQVAGDYAKWFLGRLRAVEAATAMRKPCAPAGSPRPTSSIGYALRLAGNIGLAKDFGPNVAAYWAPAAGARRLPAGGGGGTARPGSSRMWRRGSGRNQRASFRGDAKHRTRNLETSGVAIALRTSRNDGILSVTGPEFPLWLPQSQRPKSRARRIGHGRQRSAANPAI